MKLAAFDAGNGTDKKGHAYLKKMMVNKAYLKNITSVISQLQQNFKLWKPV